MDSNDDAAIQVMKVLCKCNCRISLQQLFGHLNKDGFNIRNWQSLQKFLEKYPHVFQIQEPRHHRSLVFLSAPVPICEDHSTKNGVCNQEGFCGGLHICKFFLLSDSCKFQAKGTCVYGHNLLTSHNLHVLQPYLMDRLSDLEIKRILRCIENRTFLTKPGICTFYNVEKGCNRTPCSFLHLCRHYLSDECQFGSKCKRSHNINDPKVTSILVKYGIHCQRPEDEILNDLRTLFDTSNERPLARHSSVTSLPDVTQPPTRGPRSRSLGPKRNRRVSSPSPARSDVAYEPQDQYGNYGYAYASPYLHPPQHQYGFPPGSAGNPGNQYYGPMRAGYGSYPVNRSGPHDMYPYPIDAHPPRNPGYGPPFGSPARNQGQPFHSDSQGQQMQQHGFQRTGGRQRGGPLLDPLHQNQGQRNDGARPKSHPKSRSHSVGKPSSGKQETSEKDTLDICTFFLKGKCWYGDNCMRHHKNMIYQWQYQKKQGKAKRPKEWKDFDEETNTNVEMNFCQPDKVECFVKFDGVVKISFTDAPMTGSGQDTEMDIRRLSTISSEDPGATPVVHKWITEWKWYWQTQFGEWTEYGIKDFRGFTSSLDSEAIEKAYLADPKGSVEFSTSEFSYKLNFSTMTQENTQVKTTRNVRRRPYFYKKEDLKKRNVAPSSDNVEVPDVWSCKKFMSAKQLFGHFSSPEVDHTTEEYKKIKDLFHKTLPSSNVIKSIKRIENGELWSNYYVRMAQMTIKAGKPVKELSLFHGTLKQYIDPICHQGFDSRFSGKTTGTRHGRGSYFARDAQYSDCYTEQTESQKKMFVAKVLVGESTKGKSEYVRPPAKSAQNEYELYDSCVDNTSDPSIFVIFSPEQSYPEYLISYV